MNFLRLFSQRRGGRRTAEQSFLTQGGRAVAPETGCSRARPRQRAALVQVLSHTALAPLLSDLGLACSRGKQGFARPGELCRKPNTFPVPQQRQIARQRAASACCPTARHLALCPASSGISVHDSFSISARLRNPKENTKHNLAGKYFAGRRHALC